MGKQVGQFIARKQAELALREANNELTCKAQELARSNAYYGAWALSKDAPELGVAAAAAFALLSLVLSSGCFATVYPTVVKRDDAIADDARHDDDDRWIGGDHAATSSGIGLPQSTQTPYVPSSMRDRTRS